MQNVNPGSKFLKGREEDLYCWSETSGTTSQSGNLKDDVAHQIRNLSLRYVWALNTGIRHHFDPVETKE